MSWLLIDNSNSRTKFALGDSSGLLPWRTWLPTPDLSPHSIDEALPSAAAPIRGVLIASVVPEKAALLQHHFASRFPVHSLHALSRMPIRLDYPNPHQIGADRLANAIAVARHHATPAVVLDFGTAVTFDVIESGPRYVGGVIAPGLGAMQDYLGRRTALLPRIEISEPVHAIGRSTAEAMNSGAVHGYRGLVREILLRITRELSAPPFVIATGGDAPLISQGLPEIHAVDPDITLEGLRLAAQDNLP